MQTKRLVHEVETNIVNQCDGGLEVRNLSLVPSSEEQSSCQD